MSSLLSNTPSTSKATDAVKTDAVETDTVEADVVKTDTVEADVVKTDTVEADGVKTDTVEADAVEADVVKADAVATDTVQTDTVEADAVLVTPPSTPTEPTTPLTTTTLSLAVTAEQIMRQRCDTVYRLIRRGAAGMLGGSGNFGDSTYGELTQGSMSAVIHRMKQYQELGERSSVLDVGSGLGKPSLHFGLAGVELSVGIEHSYVRYHLSIATLDDCWNTLSADYHRMLSRTMFMLGDVCDARTFDPFTHIYMYDVAFTHDLMSRLAQTFNRSSDKCRYLVSYKRNVSDYGFRVELLSQTNTSMNGSGEHHTTYLYRRLRSVSDLSVSHSHSVRRRLDMNAEAVATDSDATDSDATDSDAANTVAANTVAANTVAESPHDPLFSGVCQLIQTGRVRDAVHEVHKEFKDSPMLMRPRKLQKR
jgi:hypothetical protein